MSTRSVLDDIELSPSTRLLGWRLLEAWPDEGRISVAFEGLEAFTNPAGFIQGGFLAAMLDDVMGPAVFVHSAGQLYPVTLDLHVSYLGPARPGPLYGEGRVVQAGRSVGFLEAQLTDADGVLVARATATVRLTPAEAVARPAAKGAPAT
ncbi:MAG: PaaI family thioesterase [Caulobacterales bacterium]|nr:PaaI family thioesterase [Caulobacterales bacterium]